MTDVKFYSYSSSYSNVNGKESFKSIETIDDNGKIKTKETKTKNGITTTKYYDNTMKLDKQCHKNKKQLGQIDTTKHCDKDCKNKKDKRA